MSEMPGPPTDDYDHSIPLKAVRVRPPSPDAVHSQAAYTVHIELSRHGSVFEQGAVKKFFPHGRIYGNTLELNDTTVESIAENASTLSNELAALEREARKAEEAANLLQRQRDEIEAAETARYEHLRRMASEVRFE